MKVRPKVVENHDELAIPKLENAIYDLVMQYTTELALTNVDTYSKIYSVAINPAIKAVVEGSMLLTGGNQSEAARLLGLSRGTIRHYLIRFFGRFDIGILPNRNYEQLIKRTGLQR